MGKWNQLVWGRETISQRARCISCAFSVQTLPFCELFRSTLDRCRNSSKMHLHRNFASPQHTIESASQSPPRAFVMRARNLQVIQEFHRAGQVPAHVHLQSQLCAAGMKGMQNSISRLSALPFNDLIPTTIRYSPLNHMRRFLYIHLSPRRRRYNTTIKSASWGENYLNTALCVRSLAFTIQGTLTKMTWIIRYPWYGSGNVSARNSINCFFWKKNWSLLLLRPHVCVSCSL